MFEKISKEEYANFLEDNSYNFLQTDEIAEVYRARGAEVLYVCIKEDEIKCAALVVSWKVFGGYNYEVNFGPVFGKNQFSKKLFIEFASNLQQFAKKNQVLSLELSPDMNYQLFDNNYHSLYKDDGTIINEMAEIGFTHLGFPIGYDKQKSVATWQYVKDVSNLTEDSLMKSFSKDGSYSIKKAHSFGITVRNLEYEELSQFKELTQSAAELHNFQDKDLEYYQLFYKTFKSNADFLVTEIDFTIYKEELLESIQKLETKVSKCTTPRKEKQKKEFESQIASHHKRLNELNQMNGGESGKVLLAGAIIIYNPSETLYFISGTKEKYRKLYSSYLIQEKALIKTIRNGIPKYNFYGISGHFDGSDGILNFKKEFNGYIVQKMGTFIYYPNTLKFKAIQYLKQILRRR